MYVFKLILIFGIFKLITSHALKNLETKIGKFTHTRINTLHGKNGFDCISSREFRISENAPLHIDKILKEKIFECEVGFVCDESNPHFCSPSNRKQSSKNIIAENIFNDDDDNEDDEVDEDDEDDEDDEEGTYDDDDAEFEKILNSNININKYKMNKNNDRRNYNKIQEDKVKDFMLLERLASLSDTELDDYDNYLTNVVAMLKNNRDDYDDYNIMNDEEIDRPDIIALNCEENQLLPDGSNPQMFWYCNKRGDGHIELIHMFCGANQIYDPAITACRTNPEHDDEIGMRDELEGFVGDADMDIDTNDDSSSDEDTFRVKSDLFQKPTCDVSMDGKKIADEKDCHLYHVCFTEDFAPIKKITFICPDKMAFDPICQKCTCAAVDKYCKPTKSCKDPPDKSIEKSLDLAIVKPCEPIKSCNDTSTSMKTKSITDFESQDCPKSGSCNKICQVPFVFRQLSDCDCYFICRVDKIFKMKCPPNFIFDDYNLMCLPKVIAKCRTIEL